MGTHANKNLVNTPSENLERILDDTSGTDGTNGTNETDEMTENEYEVFWLTSVCFRTFLLRPKRATSMADVARDANVVVGFSAWRRRNSRLRAFWRHEQQAVRMAVVAATHHSCDKSMAHACTQTDDEVPAATCAATAPTPVYE